MHYLPMIPVESSFVALRRSACCLIKADTVAPAMEMSESSSEEYTEKIRGVFPMSHPLDSGLQSRAPDGVYFPDVFLHP